MANTVWKFPIAPADQVFKLNSPAIILSAALVGGEIVVYALVDPTKPKLSRFVHVSLTGGQAPQSARFVGTVVLSGGPGGAAFVCHVWTDHPIAIPPDFA